MKSVARISIIFTALIFAAGCGGGGGGGGGPTWKDSLTPLSVKSSDKRGVCNTLKEEAGIQPITFIGEGFIKVNGEFPKVKINGNAIPSGELLWNGGGACETLTDIDIDLALEECTSFTVEIDLAALPVGGVEVTVINPEAVGTSIVSSDDFFIFEPATVTDAEPSVTCEFVSGMSVTITGTNFTPQAVVTVADENGTNDPITADYVTFVDSTELIAIFEDGLPATEWIEGIPEEYSVTVDLGEGCEDFETLDSAFGVGKFPIVFFSDPPVIFNGIDTDVTVLTANLGTKPDSIELIDSSGTAVADPVITFENGGRPNRNIITVPDGLTPDLDDPYDIRVTSYYGCVGELADGLDARAETNMVLASVEPQHASKNETQAVTIFLDDTNPSDPTFVEMPRAYLNPAFESLNPSATPLKAVVMPDPNDHTRLSALIPAGMEPGLYDLIVVNPTGEIGTLLIDRAADPDEIGNGVMVIDGDLPYVDKVSPGTFTTTTALTATIDGGNFDNQAGVDVELNCKERDGTNIGPIYGTNTSNSTTQITTTFNTEVLTHGSVCLVGVTNKGDGSRYDYSAVTTWSPSSNLPTCIQEEHSLTTARRGLELTVAKPTDTSRYLYAIGGDDGTDSGVYDTVEYITVDPFGALSGGWQELIGSSPETRGGSAPHSILPSGLSFFGEARTDDFIYILGGTDGSENLDTVYRAQVLSPENTPLIDDLDAALGDPEAAQPTGLGAGLWFYKVSALFPSDDASNPGGESLPGEVLVAQLPAIDGNGLLLTLKWLDVPGASAYRIYRTPAADMSVTELQFLAEKSCGDNADDLCDCATNAENCQWTDTGIIAQASSPAETTPADYPLTTGSLGVWHQPTLNNNGSDSVYLTTQRNGVATAIAPSPSDPNVCYIYAYGGVNGDGTYLNTYEWASITKNPDGSQSLSAFETGNDPIGPTGFMDGNIWVVTPNDTAEVTPDRVYLYFSGGVDIANSDSSVLYTGFLDTGSADGDLGVIAEEKLGYQSPRSGASALDANGYLYILGGLTVSNSKIVNTDSSGNLTYDVDLDRLVFAPNSLGSGSLTQRRAYAGSADESAFFYIGGGLTGYDDITSEPILTTTVERNTK
ncbi:MAG: hypothetical protein C0609_05180 [Deltaproteobacteria bacterium]|nr:MAG: hypothetical protein C0609_05180 [Deltaproteobacteria bacterium]